MSAHQSPGSTRSDESSVLTPSSPSATSTEYFDHTNTYTTYLSHLSQKLDQPFDPKVSGHITTGGHLIGEDDDARASQAQRHYHEALNAASANGISITIALNGLLAAHRVNLMQENFTEELHTLERVRAGYHFMFGTECTEYWELALHCCTLASCTDQASEYLSLFRKATTRLFQTESTAPDGQVMSTARAYFRNGKMSLKELKTLMADYMTFMESTGRFAESYFEWFELSVFYDEEDIGLVEEADDCLVRALDAANIREDFFSTEGNPRALFLYFPHGDWSGEHRASLLPKLLELEAGLRTHEAASQKRETECWIWMCTIYAKLEAYKDATRAISEVKARLRIAPVEDTRLIWALDQPYRSGMRQLWQICAEDDRMLTLGYIDLVEQFMPVVIKALRKWVGPECAEIRDAIEALNRMREIYTEQEVETDESDDW